MGPGRAALTDDDLLVVLSAVGVQAQVRGLEITASTNSTALGMARDGAPPWSLVTAGHQTAGRGREGRTWVDVPGGSLLCSVLVPELRPLGLTSLLAGASMTEAIRDLAGVDARCKWPNDILVGGEKVCGILIESVITDGAVETVVVGAGVDLARPDVEGAGQIGDIDPQALLIAYLRGLQAGIAEPARVVSRWLVHNDTVGREVRVGGAEAQVDGLAVGVSEDGDLIVRTRDGMTTLVSGQVAHLP